MSQIRCLCGHLVKDHGGPIAYKANFVRDVERRALSEKVSLEIASYLQAKLEGMAGNWLIDRFGPEYADREPDDAGVVLQILNSNRLDKDGSAYECEQCGRLIVQNLKKGNSFVVYLNEKDKEKGIFNV